MVDVALNPHVVLIPAYKWPKAMQTIVRNAKTPRSEFLL